MQTLDLNGKVAVRDEDACKAAMLMLEGLECSSMHRDEMVEEK